MSDLEELLVLQGYDTVLDQLRHRRRTLHERVALQQLEDALAGLEKRRDQVASELAAIAERQDETERETAAAVARIAAIDARMRSGAVAARDLVAMQSEIDHLQQRQREMEDRTLAAMEEREPVEADLAAIDEERSRLDTDAAAARAALAEAEVAIDAEIAAASGQREASASKLPSPLLQQYERLRQRLDGVGAAALIGASCGGCHLSLPATELDRIKKLPPDAVAHCEQCGRILVRPS